MSMLTVEGRSQTKLAHQQMSASDGRNGKMRLNSASTHTSGDESETTSDKEGGANNAIKYQPDNLKKYVIPARQRTLKELKGVEFQGSSPASSHRLNSSHPLHCEQSSAINRCASTIVLLYGDNKRQPIACMNRV
jgi:hypothetical protein